MSYNFTQKAKDATSTSPIMVGRTKCSTDELIVEYPDGVHVFAIDKLSGKDGDYFVFTFMEDISKFCNGGSVFGTIADEWLKDFDGNTEVLNSELEKSGGVLMRFYKATSKQGRRYTAIEVL